MTAKKAPKHRTKKQNKIEQAPFLSAGTPEFRVAKERAKELFMNHEPVPDIGRKLGLRHATLISWIYGATNHKGTDKNTKAGWKFKRDELKSELLKEMTSDKGAMLLDMADNMIWLVHQAIDEMKKKVMNKEVDSISLTAAQQFTRMLIDLDKIIQTDKTKEKEDKANIKKPASVEEIQARLNADPFANKPEETK